MLGKLLKYDFRSMWKQFAFVWLAALVIAPIAGFTTRGILSGATQTKATLSMFLIITWFAIMIAMSVLTLVFVVQRFYKGLLGNEGYLMHTLPVRPWQLITSKLICSVTAEVISILVAIASFLTIFFVTPEVRQDFLEGVTMTAHSLPVWHLLLALFLAIIQVCLLIYLSIAVGHLFSKNRIAASVIALVVLNSVMSAVSNGLHSIIDFTANYWISLVTNAIFATVFFLATNYILSRKLNLE